MHVLNTERLALRWLTVDDADFILQLINDPDWIRYIGDKGVRTKEAAQRYLQDGPISMYAQHGFGLYLVALKSDDTSIGLCGLIKRESLADVDIGYAFLPAYRGHGYAIEAATGVLSHGRIFHDLKRIVAITSPHNAASIQLLGKLGMQFERTVPSPQGHGEVCLYAVNLPPNGM